MTKYDKYTKRVTELYPNATHPERMTHAQQKSLGDIEQPAQVSDAVVEDNVMQGTNTQEPQTKQAPQRTQKAQVTIASDIKPCAITEGIGGEIVLPGSVLYAGSDVARKAMGINDTVIVATSPSIPSPSIPSPNVTEATNNAHAIATNVVAGVIIEGIGGKPALEGSVLYTGSKVARDAVCVTDSVNVKATPSTADIKPCAITEGIGGEIVLPGSVLYAGSDVARKAMGINDTVIVATSPSIPSPSIPSPNVTEATNNAHAIATNVVAGVIIEGIGGKPALEGSVLYTGSKVARDAVCVADSVNVKATPSTAPYNTTSTAPYGATQSPSAPYTTATQTAVPDEDEAMQYDVLIVGGGASGLSTAIRLKQMAQEEGKDISVCLIEKGADIGSHILSGAVLEPRALEELLPNWRELNAPLDTPALHDDFLFLTKNKSLKMPTPPQMHNEGNYIISLGKFCKWLGTIAEDMGVEIYTGTSASEIIKEDGRVVGVRSGAFGIDKNGDKTGNHADGMELRATYTVMGEGCRGHLTKGLFEEFNLRDNTDPQTFGIGLKELWEIPAELSEPGKIVHTTGWPLDSKTYGGSFLYHLEGNQVAVGFVIGLDYANPHLSPYMEFQRFKHHPSIAKNLKGGRRISYGARAINEGGYQSIPSLVFNGGMLVGCTAGFLNVPKIKGTHTAMKSGMIAGEEIFKAIRSENTPELLEAYPQALEKSWVYEELHKVRNIRPSFHKFNFWGGLLYSALATYIFRGSEPWTFKNHDDHSTMGKASDYKKIEYPTPDGVLSFDRLTNVAFAGTIHEENQPCHLILKDTDIPITVNLKDYDMPETRYCPAGVYELVEKEGVPALQINAQNCVHCKTCDIKDPCQNINWVVPEGGCGPNYQGM